MTQYCEQCGHQMILSGQYDRNGNPYWVCPKNCICSDECDHPQELSPEEVFEMFEQLDSSFECIDNKLSSQYETNSNLYDQKSYGVEIQPSISKFIEEIEKKYNLKGCPKVDQNKLYEFFTVLDQDQSISKSLFKWIKKNKLLNIVSQVYYKKYKSYNELWYLATACSFYRKDKKPEIVLELTKNIETFELNKYSAILTTRGGAYRDLGGYNNAIKCAEKAINNSKKIGKETPHPHNLLGGIYYDLGRYAEGSACFLKATKLGEKKTNQDRQIEEMLKDGRPDRPQLAEFLLKEDENRFDWVKSIQFNVSNSF